MALNDLRRVPESIRAAIWESDLSAEPLLRAVGLGVLRTLWAVLRDVHEGELSLRAMSLVYTTLLSLVPLLAISFSVLKGFGVHQELEEMLMRVLAPLGERGVEIGSRIIEFVDNVKVGVLGSVGLVLLVYTVISLMQKIERAFNYIWHVPQTRPFAQRFSGYLSVILIGPLLVFSAMGISASLMSSSVVTTLSAIEPLGAIIRFAGQLVPFVLVVGAFTFIYVFIPNTRVNVVSAFTGALVAGAMWIVMSWAFATFVVTSAKYTAIYSAFAALIFFMLWMYVAWLVLLIGSTVALYHQHPEDLQLARRSNVLSPRMTERLSFAVLAEIGRAFMRGDTAPTDDDIAARLRVAVRTIDRLTDLLAATGFIVATADTPNRWVPSRAPETISLGQVMTTVRTAGDLGSIGKVKVAAVVTQILDDADEARDHVFDSKSLADLVSMADDTSAEITPLPSAGGSA